MLVSELLSAAWEQARQNWYYVNRWSKDSPRVADALQYYMNHGQLDPERAPIPEGDHYCQQLYLMGQAMYQSLAAEKLVRFPVLGPLTLVQRDYSIVKAMNGWPGVVLRVPTGTRIYAVTDSFKVPHINDDGSFPCDGLNSWRFGFQGAEMLEPLSPDNRKFDQGVAFAKVVDPNGLLFSAAGPVSNLMKAIFGQ